MLEHSKQIDLDSASFKDFAKLWIDTGLRRKDISVRVREEYCSILEKRVFGIIGDMKFSEISAFELDSLVDELGKMGYSAKTIRNTISVVKLIFKYAYKKGFRDDNPVDRMDDLPKISRNRTVSCFSPEDTRRFLDFLDNYPLKVKVFFTLMIYGGFRRGELCAVRWEDVDFKRGTLSISRAVSQTKTGQIIKTPKTESSARVVALPNVCLELLKELKELQFNESQYISENNEMKAFGGFAEDVLPNSYIFTNRDGSDFINPHIQTKHFRNIVDDYNKTPEGQLHPLPNIRLHDLRHTSATLLISSGTDVVTVSHRLGHANPSVTLNIYSHFLPQTDVKAARKLENMLKR